MAARARPGRGLNAEAGTELFVAHSRGRLFGELFHRGDPARRRFAGGSCGFDNRSPVAMTVSVPGGCPRVKVERSPSVRGPKRDRPASPAPKPARELQTRAPGRGLRCQADRWVGEFDSPPRHRSTQSHAKTDYAGPAWRSADDRGSTLHPMRAPRSLRSGRMARKTRWYRYQGIVVHR